MKRNLLSIITLALVIVNIALTVFLLFTVIPANKKTTALVTDIASVMNLELYGADGSTTGGPAVNVADTVTYDIADQMTISLRHGSDEKDHYAICSVTLAMDSKHDDYANYGSDEQLKTMESMIKNAIIDSVGSLSYDEAQVMSSAEISQMVLEKVQEIYGSDFIYKIVFRDIMFQ